MEFLEKYLKFICYVIIEALLFVALVAGIITLVIFLVFCSQQLLVMILGGC